MTNQLDWPGDIAIVRHSYKVPKSGPSRCWVVKEAEVKRLTIMASLLTLLACVGGWLAQSGTAEPVQRAAPGSSWVIPDFSLPPPGPTTKPLSGNEVIIAPLPTTKVANGPATAETQD